MVTLTGASARHAKPSEPRVAAAVEELARRAVPGVDAAADLARRTAARTSGRIRMILAMSWPDRHRATWWLPMILFVTGLDLVITTAIYRWLTDETVISLLFLCSSLTIGIVGILEARAAAREKACREGAPLRLIAGGPMPMIPVVLAEQVQANSAAIAEVLRTQKLYSSAFRQMCEIAGIDLDGETGRQDDQTGTGRPHLRVVPGGPAA